MINSFKSSGQYGRLQEELLAGWATEYGAEQHIYQKLLAELSQLGMNHEEAAFFPEGNVLKSSFKWKHPKSRAKKQCDIVMITKEIDLADKPLLKGYDNYLPESGFDVMLFKAYNSSGRIGFIESYMKSNNATVISDYPVDPEDTLKDLGLTPISLPEWVTAKYLSLQKRGYDFGHPHKSYSPVTIYRIM